MTVFPERLSHQFLPEQKLAPRPMTLADVEPHARPQVEESPIAGLNSLQQQLNKHPAG